MYIAILLAFLGIESEVVDYQKNQEKILEQVAKDKIADLIIPGKTIEEPRENSLFYRFELRGDYDPSKFEGKLVFVNQTEYKNDFKTNISHVDQSTRDFTAEMFIKDFGEFDSHEYALQLEYELDPVFSEAARIDLIKSFGSKDISDKIINNVLSSGRVSGSIDLPITTIPSQKSGYTVFDLNPNINPFTGLEGVKGKIKVWVSGTGRKSDYSLSIDAISIRELGAQIVKDIDNSIIKFNKIKSHDMHLTAKHRDGRVVQDIIIIKSVKPQWKYHNPKEVFVGDLLTFDGKLIGLDNPIDETRYKLQITGDATQSTDTISGSMFEIGPLQFEGNLDVQLFVDENKIENMVHKIIVKRPPCPDISYNQQGKSVNVRVTAYGSGNKITGVLPRAGGKIDKRSHKIDKDKYTETHSYMLSLTGDPPRVKLKLTIMSNYCDNITEEQTFIVRD